MKKIVMMVSIAIASIGFTYGQQGQTQQGRTQEGQRGGQQQEQTQRGTQGQQELRDINRGDKDEIENNELPNNIQSSLNTGEFSGWEIDEAFRVSPDKRQETGVAYEVKVKRDNEHMRLQYDERGNLVGREMKDKNRSGKSGDHKGSSR
jgi:YD repeat-containing protein